MSTDNKTTTERLSDVAVRANALCQTVAEQANAMQNQVNNAITSTQSQIDTFTSGTFRNEIPFLRLTKNQQLKINGKLEIGAKGIPDGFTLNGEVHGKYFETEIVDVSRTDKEPGQRSSEQLAFWKNVQGTAPKYHKPEFAIVRITALDVNNYPTDSNRQYSLYQGGTPYNTAITFGAFVKVEQGKVGFGSGRFSKLVPADGEWHTMVEQISAPPKGGANYIHGPHIHLEKGSSCLVALPATVLGWVPQERWGYFEKPVLESEL
ncbi:hypothetical protein [Pseudoalteromonas rubra]|uniref:Uncharacterized protein n=1 Tax=Pseudoalteromonas rubra TaxID=43658 RepID=A0A0U3IMV9_9GAMM|nr:hypothetical protein [Pseudoalteromonas rubra]ALU44636.1 hypothetical protein AT705_17830 [Pseudoalteromonas rubra]